jgi:dihydroxyacetone kinase
MKLDDDLTRWLDHPCETPALRVGQSSVEQAAPTRAPQARMQPKTRLSIDRSQLKTEGDITPARFRDLMAASLGAIQADRERLNALDGAIGDGDHGLTMEIGWKAVQAVLDTADVSSVTIIEMCDDIAEAFLGSVGASVGPLYSSGFQTAGRAVSDRLNLDTEALVLWLEGMVSGIQQRGGACPGQKTMVDAWVPAVAAARAELEQGGTSAECMAAAAEAAASGAASTKDLLSQMGRSKKLGARSRGHADPGAESAAVLLKAWAAARW